MNRSEGGTVTVFVTVFFLALLVVAGLVIDGGRLLAARREAANLAESAARAGAQELDTAFVHTADGVALDGPRARHRAEQYLAAAGVDGSVRVSGDSVDVEVTTTRRLFLLGIVGPGEVSVTASGSARGVRAVAEASR